MYLMIYGKRFFYGLVSSDKTYPTNHFKQRGHWIPASQVEKPNGKREVVLNQNGNKISMIALGKKAAGRIFDGTTWDQVASPAI